MTLIASQKYSRLLQVQPKDLKNADRNEKASPKLIGEAF